MLKNYVPAEYHTITEYEVRFFVDNCGGMAFPCDKDGNILTEKMSPCAIENYHRCMENPDKYAIFNKVVTNHYQVRDEAHGTCSCGKEVYLCNEYYGACQCEHCGQWYNLFGQEILPPDEWEEETEEW